MTPEVAKEKVLEPTGAVDGRVWYMVYAEHAEAERRR